jgi:AcrR family transcriptional regulator
MSRQEILKAAAHIFREKGFHATSMRDIAGAVNLQKASLYHHIESKQEILLALLDQALDMLIEDLEKIVESDQSPPLKLEAAIHNYVEKLAANADLAGVLLLEYRSLASEFKRRHVSRRDRFEALWRRILEEGMANGDFRRMDPAVTGFALLGVQNWLITWYRPDGAQSPGEIADHFHSLFLQGLAQEPGDS